MLLPVLLNLSIDLFMLLYVLVVEIIHLLCLASLTLPHLLRRFLQQFNLMNDTYVVLLLEVELSLLL